MATVTSLGFSIFSKFNGKGVIEAKRALSSLDRMSPTVTVNVRVSKAMADIKRIRQSLRSITDRSVSVHVRTGKARADVSKFRSVLSRLSDKTIAVHVRTSAATNAIRRIARQMSSLHDVTVHVRVNAKSADAQVANLARRLRGLDTTVHVRANTSEASAALARFMANRRHLNVSINMSTLRRSILEAEVALIRLLRNRTIHVRVEVQMGSAMRQLAELTQILSMATRDRTIHIHVDRDGAMRSAERAAFSAGGAFSSQFGQALSGDMGSVFTLAFRNPIVMVALIGAAGLLASAAATAFAGVLTLGVGGAIIGIGMMIERKNKQVRASFHNTWRTIKNDAKDAFSPLIPVMLAVSGVLKRLSKVFSPVVKKMMQMVQPVLLQFLGYLEQALMMLLPVLPSLFNALNQILKVLGPKLPKMFQLFAEALIIIFNAIAENPDAFVSLLVGAAYMLKFAASATAWLIDRFTVFLSNLQQIYGWWKKVSGPIKAFVGWARTLAAFTPFAHMFDADPLKNFVSWVHYTGVVIKKIPGAFAAIGRSIKASWNSTWNSVRNIFNSVWGRVRSSVSASASWIVNKFGSIRSGTVTRWNAMWNSIRNTFNSAWGRIRGTLNNMGSWMSAKFSAIRGWVGGRWNAMWNGMRGAFNSAWSRIRNSVSVMGSWLSSRFSSIRSWVGGRWNALWTWMRNIFNYAWGKIRNSVSVMGSWLSGKFSSIRHWVGDKWNALWSWMRNIFNFAWGKIRNSISVMGSWLSGKFSSIRSWVGSRWNSLWAWMRNIFNFAWGKIRGSVDVMGSWLSRKFSAIKGWVGSRWNSLWTWMRNIFNFAWGKIRGSLNVMGNWLSNHFSRIKSWVGSRWNQLWTWMRNIFNYAWGKLHGSMLVMGNWMGKQYTNVRNWVTRVWRQMWDNIRGTFNWTWGKLRGSMYVMKDTMARIWHGIVNTAKSVWEGIKKAIGRPINFVIGFVGDRLVPAANTILKAVGVGGLPNISKYKIPGVATGGVVGTSGIDRGYAAGGVLPGYSPGKDIHIAQSPLGPIGLSGGEGILRPEVMRAPGMADFLHGANRMARHGGLSAVRNWLFGGSIPSPLNTNHNNAVPGEGIAFANGGIVPTVANFDGGGIFGKIKDWGGKAMGIVNPIAKIAGKKAKEFVWDKGGRKILEGIVGKIWASLSGWLNSRGIMGRGIAGVGKKVLDGVFNHVESKTAPPDMGGITWANASARLKKGLAWAKTQNGKPYQWGGGGNPSWDCSGFMAGIQSVIMGQSPHRMYTTFDFSGKRAPSGWQQNLTSPFMVGVTNSGVGHMAGTLLGTNVEASGSNDVRVGGPARGYDNKMFRDKYGYKPVVKDARMVSGGGNFGPGGWAKAYFTMFNDSSVASGGGMTPDTVASSYLPLGSRVAVARGGRQAQGTIRDLGPAAFVYARHPGMAVLDLSPQLSSRMGGDGVGQWKLLSVGKGRTLYGKRLRGYSGGGRVPGGQTSLVGENGAEVMTTNTSARVFKSGSTVSVGDTHVHFHDKVYVKSEREFKKMVISAIDEAKRKKQI